MDAQTHRVITTIREYLDDCQSRSALPPNVNQEMLDSLNNIADDLSHGGANEELSPGQLAVQEAASGYVDSTVLSPRDDLSPGERAAQSVAADS